MKNKIFFTLSFLSLLGIFSCIDVSIQSIDPILEQEKDLPCLDAGIPDASVCPPSATPDGCSRCYDVILDPSKAPNLCQNFDGIPGGVPSEWIYEHTVTCICSGACADLCPSECHLNAQTQFIFDQSILTIDCEKCIQREPHSSIEPAGCGSQFSFCQLDSTL